MMNKKNIISLITGVAFSTAALFLAFRNIPFQEVLQYFGKVNYLWLIPGIAAGLISFLLRAVRWQLILSTADKKMPLGLVFHTLMTGFMLNCVLPLRIGEIARPMILKKKKGLSFTTGVATIATERTFDLTVLIILFAVVLSAVNIDPELVVAVGDYRITAKILSGIFDGMIKLSLILISGIIAINISFVRKKITGIITYMPKLLFFLPEKRKSIIHDRISLPLNKMIETFAEGFRLIRKPDRLFLCTSLSFAIWGIQAISYQLVSFGCPGIELSMMEMSTVMIIICFAIALPSVPGYWGLWEAGGIFALAVFSVAGGNAAGYTLVNHVIQVVPIILAGAVSALIIGTNINQIFNKR